MQQEISGEDWKVICSEAHLVTCSNIWREFKWKVIARYFQTPQIMAKMEPSNKCRINCGAQIGNQNLVMLHSKSSIYLFPEWS